MRALLESLYNRTMNTRDARFEAARRMARCDRFSVACLAFLSLEIIAINIVQLVITTQDRTFDSCVSAATIILSVFALVLSLMVNQAQYSVKRSVYTNCALSLDELAYDVNRLLKAGTEITTEDVAQFEKEYIDIRKYANLNHDTSDYEWSQRNSEKVKDSYGYKSNPIPYWRYRMTLWLRHWIFTTYFLYLLITVMGAVMVFWFIWNSLNMTSL